MSEKFDIEVRGLQVRVEVVVEEKRFVTWYSAYVNCPFFETCRSRLQAEKRETLSQVRIDARKAINAHLRDVHKLP